MAVSMKAGSVSTRRACVGVSSKPTFCLRPNVLVRFKEDNRDRMEELQQRRQQEESVIRDQEKKLREQGSNVESDFMQRFNQASRTNLPDVPTGRADMDPDAPKENPYVPAFTRRREIFAGRLAMLGFFAACFWEWLLPGHPNITEQIAIPFNALGIPLPQPLIGTALFTLITLNLVFSLLPSAPTWDPANQRDIQKRPAGPPQNFINPLDFKKFFGVTDWGFTKANELFHGRAAMIGFTAVLFQQLSAGGYFGPGPLAQVAEFFGGITPNGAWYASVGVFFVGFSILATVLAYQNGKPGTLQGEEEIY